MGRFALLILLCGCSARPQLPNGYIPMTHGTHKVWLSQDYVTWQDDEGFGCGNVYRTRNGLVYKASIINWNPSRSAYNLHNDFNNFEDAVAWVEKWCKP